MLAPLLAGASAPAREDGHNANRPTRGQLHRAARLAREGKPDPNTAPVQHPPAATNKQAEPAEASALSSERERAAAYQSLHRALLAGLPTQIGHRTEKGDYLAARQRRFVPFPGSALARKPPPWIVAATLLDTQKYGA